MADSTSAWLRELLATAHVGTWDWLVASDKVEWSADVDHFFGMPKGTFAGTYQAYLDLIHEEDRPRIMQNVAALLQGTQDEYALEHRIIWPDGSVHWLSCTARCTRDDQGKAVRLGGTVIDVTTRRAAEDALRDSEQVFRSAMHHSPIGMAMVALNGRFIDVNPAVCAILGYERDALVELDYQSLTHPDDQHLSSESVKKLLAGDVPSFQLDKRYIRADGRVVWTQLNCSLVRGGDGAPRYFVSQLQDVGDRRAAEHALRGSEALLRQLADNLREVVWLRDLDLDRMLYVSSTYAHVFGAEPQRLLENPRAWLDAVHDDDRGWVSRAVEAAEKTDGFDEYFRVRVGNGLRWVRARIFPIRDVDGRVYRVAGVAEDITEHRRTEEQTRHAQKMEAIGQFAGGVAHDFNNMLAVILAHTELASLDDTLPASMKESLREITEVSRRAATLTRQLLQFSRKDVLRPRAVDMNDVVRTFATMLRRLLREDVTLTLALSEGHLPVLADPSLLDQVLMNLAVNARDAMPSGGSLTIETRHVDVHESGDVTPGEYACLCVKDTGVGIGPDALSRLFEPFFTTKPPGKGTGLGLATVFGIVKQHGGTVTVDSREGEGSTFCVYLPAANELSAPEVEREGHRPVSGGSETILVVEDDAAVRAATELTLKRHGYRVLTAADGESAYRTWDVRRADIKLIITDLVMPGRLNGRQLVEKILRSAPGTRFVLTSGYSQEFFGQDLVLTDAANFVSKPVPMTRLLDVVRRALDAPAQDPQE
ncbi:MAG: PAS domain-containing protein [Archangium sp.]